MVYSNPNVINLSSGGNKNNFSIVLISIFGYDFGIRYISSFLKARGYQTCLVQFNQLKYIPEFLDNDYFTAPLLKHKVYSSEDVRLLIDLLKQLRPKVIGISLTSVTMKIAQIITSEIKKHLDSIVVWGGIHAIISPEECIRYADIVCTGEGEIPMLELVEKIKKNQPLTGIKNLWINNNGEIEKNELGPLIEDLDSIPFADFLEEGNKFLIDSGRISKAFYIISAYERYSYPIITSRGCMFSCSFCCNGIIKEKYIDKGPYLRRRGVKNVIAELKLAIRKSPIGLVKFWDDVFTYDKDWLKEFCSVYVKEIGKPFACYVYPKYTDKDIIFELAKAGLVSIVLGVQSGSETINRELFGRSQSNQALLEFANIFKRLSVSLRCDLISDNPYETDQEQDDTVELLLKLPRPYLIQIYSLCYFPKTPLTKKALDDKVITVQDLEQYSSKALNNFFMFLLLSKTKKQFFWNCIKAMAINKHFPREFVRFCKENIFFRRYPKFLFLFCRYYLYLFKFIRWKRMRVLAAPSLKDGVFIRDFLVFGEARFLFYEPKILFLFFPLYRTNASSEFCLSVTNKFMNNLFMHFLIEIIPFTESKLANKTVWYMECEIKNSCQNNIYLNLKYPELYVSFNGSITKLNSLRIGDFDVNDKRLYVLKIKYGYRKRFSLWRFNYRLIGRIICSAQKRIKSNNIVKIRDNFNK